MGETPSINRGKVLRYGLYAEGKDVTDTAELISFTIRKAINRIGKTTLVLDADEKPVGTFALSDGATFKPGVGIKITAGYDKERSSLDTLFEGTIIAHRLTINDRERAQLTLECRDYGYAATLGRKNAVFEKAKDGDIIKKILGANGLSASTDSTYVEYPQLIQYYSTDWDFALSRADINGLVIITEGKSVTVKKPDVSKSPLLTVEYGQDLIAFDGSLSASDQYAKTVANAWEISTQALVTATGAKPGLNSQGDIAADKLSDAGGDELLYQTSASVGKEALQAWVDSQALKNGLSRFQGTITFDGNSKAKPGTLIELKKMGTHFNGNAYVSSVEHTLKGGTWITKAGMGLSPENITEQPDVTAPPASGLLPGIEGLQIGKVKAISEEKDSEHFIQVEMALLGGKTKTVWARPASYYASNNVGCYFMPETGDEVILGFVNNDPCYPVIIGSLYSRKQKPPIPVDKENKIKTIVTKGKNKITIDDDKLIITIETPGKNKLTLNDDDKKIELADQNSNKITMSKDGISLESNKDILLKAKGNVKINATQNLETESKCDTKMKGMNVEATGQIGIKLKGSATAELSASGQTTVKGAMVMIN